MIDNVKFEQIDFPALYQIADDSSLKGQKLYLNFFRWEQITLIAGAIVSLFPLSDPDYGYLLAMLAALCFIAAIALSVAMKSKKFENSWYVGRAVAESIKTLTWRYITKGEPFVNNSSQQEVDTHFCTVINQIRKNNEDNLDLTIIASHNEQITSKMRMIRSHDLEQRKKFYVENRIKDQLAWYQRKARFNKDKGSLYFKGLIVCQSIAVIYSGILIKYPDLFNSIPLITTIASCIIGWTQVKQYEELAQAYSTTAQDIAIILSQEQYLDDEDKFSSFVGDAENAFSREHTLWLARKDVYDYSH